ncbi:MAG: Ku protein, partial [Candidatus Limnocylindrales bacterium]
VAAMTQSFDPAAHRDDYRDALMAIIDAKAGGLTPVAPLETPIPTVVDLMAALEASVAAARAARAAQPLRAVVAASTDEATTFTEIPATKSTRRSDRRRKTA